MTDDEASVSANETEPIRNSVTFFAANDFAEAIFLENEFEIGIEIGFANAIGDDHCGLYDHSSAICNRSNEEKTYQLTNARMEK